MQRAAELCLAFALGCVDEDTRAERLARHLGEHTADEALIREEFPRLYPHLVPLTYERVVRYWTIVHACMKEQTPVRYARVYDLTWVNTGFVQVQMIYAIGQVRLAFVRNYRNLVLSEGDLVLIHHCSLAMTAEELAHG